MDDNERIGLLEEKVDFLIEMFWDYIISTEAYPDSQKQKERDKAIWCDEWVDEVTKILCK